jgi:hypothetical protein
MSRWDDAFAALSRGSDTLDALRHSAEPPLEVSQTVTSVTAAPAPLATADCGQGARWGDEKEERRRSGSSSPLGGGVRPPLCRPPADVPLKRWQTFIDDLGRFLDGPFLDVAVKLGWGPYDLFGCDRDRPFARIDCMGLLWLLNSRKFVALTETTATIETTTGATQRFWRKPAEPCQCLAWELEPLP